MAQSRSFKEYIANRFYNEFFTAVSDFLEQNHRDLDISSKRVYKIDRAELSDISVKHVFIENHPGMRISFDVLIEADFEIGDYDEFGQAFLTDYARHHMDECCLVFDLTVHRGANSYGKQFYTECVLYRDATSDITFEAHFSDSKLNDDVNAQANAIRAYNEELAKVMQELPGGFSGALKSLMTCPPSARVCESYEDKGSNYAAEGTDAHTLCEHKLKTLLGIPSKDPTEDLTYYSQEMEDCADGYAAYILELVETAKKTCSDPLVLIEQRLDFSRYVEGGFGTGDCVIIADGVLHICDFKFGAGIIVTSENNPQMKLYALGALEIFDGIYDIDSVSMTIYQPRRDNISTHAFIKTE